MSEEPGYEELEQTVKELEKESLEYKQPSQTSPSRCRQKRPFRNRSRSTKRAEIQTNGREYS